MNTRHALLLAALLASPALAADKADVRALANHSGLDEPEVRMLLRGRTAWDHRFPQHFDRIERQLIEALGEDDYRRLTSGESIVLHVRPAPTRIAEATPR